MRYNPILPILAGLTGFAGTLYAVGGRGSRINPSTVVDARMVTLPAGFRLHHGTPSKRGWKVPRGPAWFSEHEAVAKKYAKRSGRVLSFDLPRDVELLAFRDTVEYSKVTASLARSLGVSLDTPGHQIVCAAGFSGWTFPDAYEPGSDIMLCDPSAFWKD